MKKLFIVLAVVSLGFVACNNSGEKTDGTDTTTTPEVVVPDTTATPAPDTTATPVADTSGAAK